MAKTKAKPSLKDILDTYEKQKDKTIDLIIKKIMELMDAAASKSAYTAAQRKLINNRFLPKDVRRAINIIIATLESDIEKLLVNGIKKAWAISNEKNDTIVDTQASGSGNKPPKTPKVSASASGSSQDMYNHNFSARDSFIKRKDVGGKNAGLNLSKRVWKVSNLAKKTINDTIVEGLKNGDSAREMAKKTRSNLRNNKVVENPGTGTYKSPQKNAMRLTRNEINLSYAQSDYLRWQELWFVVGIEVKLSNRHPKYDMCDNLKGIYPKTFQYSKWHVNCICFAIPVLASEEVRNQMMEYELGLRKEKPEVVYVKELPKNAVTWMKDNAERVNGWSSKPYWIQNNSKTVSDYFKK